MMMKPLQAKAKLERKANLLKGTGTQKSNGKFSRARIPQSSIFAVSEGGEKPATPLSRLGMTMKKKMRPKPKSKEKPSLLTPVVDDEEENMADPDVNGERDAADLESRQSSSLGPSTLVDPTHVEIKEKSHLMMLGDAGIIVADHHSSGVVPVETTPMTTASFPTDESVSAKHKEEPAQPMKAGRSKLPLGKKRQPTSMTPVGRVTRSVSKQKDQGESSELGSSSFVFYVLELTILQSCEQNLPHQYLQHSNGPLLGGLRKLLHLLQKSPWISMPLTRSKSFYQARP
jgi:hypothetical protein